jgi:hypothetical protein
MPLLIVDVPRKCCYQVTESASERGSVSWYGAPSCIQYTSSHTEGYRSIDLRGTIRLLIVTAATDNSPLERVRDPSSSLASARLLLVMKCARLATCRNMADSYDIEKASGQSGWKTKTSVTNTRGVQANLQGLDWPTGPPLYRKTGQRPVRGSSVGVRLNNYAHVLSAECLEINVAELEELLLLTLPYPPVVKGKTNRNLPVY